MRLGSLPDVQAKQLALCQPKTDRRLLPNHSVPVPPLGKSFLWIQTPDSCSFRG